MRSGHPINAPRECARHPRSPRRLSTQLAAKKTPEKACSLIVSPLKGEKIYQLQSVGWLAHQARLNRLVRNTHAVSGLGAVSRFAVAWLTGLSRRFSRSIRFGCGLGVEKCPCGVWTGSGSDAGDPAARGWAAGPGAPLSSGGRHRSQAWMTAQTTSMTTTLKLSAKWYVWPSPW